MAIYWIDPHTTTNGTGTFASPYSFASSTRTALVSGDEMRIKGVALTSLLTATVYTFNITSNYQITYVSGGSISDFAVNNVLYFPGNDVFFKVGGISGSVLSSYGGTTSMLPWYNTSSGQTITVRRVDTATYGPSSSGVTPTLLANSSTDNITVTDCWIDATTRVTDGSVKSLVNSTATGGQSFYIDGAATPSAVSANRVYDMANTHILPVNGNFGTGFFLYASNVTATIGQLSNPSGAGGLTIGVSGFRSENVTLRFKNLNHMILVASASNTENLTLTYDNITARAASTFFSAGSFTIASNTTFNIGNAAVVESSPVLLGTSLTYFSDVTVNLDGIIDTYQNNALSNGLSSLAGNVVVNYGPSFICYQNRRASTITSVGARGYTSAGFPTDTYFPAVPLPTGWTATTDYIHNGSSTIVNNNNTLPVTLSISLPAAISVATDSPRTAISRLVNTLVTFRDGSAPYEVLGVYAPRSTQFLTQALSPMLSVDATVYRTAGPSLEAYLATRSTGLWIGPASSKAVKSIRVPVTSGVVCTVAGYIRTDQATYLLGDCRMALFFNGTKVATQNMTTACIGAWEAFSLSFTPSFTGEALLLWEMYYSASGSYWLDDLAVS